MWRALWLALLIGWYGVATLPYLGDYPLVNFDEAGIAAPAAKLANEGVYGNDLYAGYYQSETYNYEYMPLYPLLVALSFKLLGVGVVQARLVSVLCGLALVLLTFDLGRRLYDSSVGLTAATALCYLRLSGDPRGSGVLLPDLARIARYDVLMAAFVVASCCCFIAAYQRSARRLYAGAGALAGLATVSHPNGALIMVVLIGALLWQCGPRALRETPLYLLVVGWLIVCAAWLIYVAQNVAAFRGQILRHVALGRFNLLDPAFYWGNIATEGDRYSRLVDLRPQFLHLPTFGMYLTCAALLATLAGLSARLCRRAERVAEQMLADRLLILCAPVLAALLAVLINHKYYGYLVLILPFVAVQIAFGVVMAWRCASSRLSSTKGAPAARRIPCRRALPVLIRLALSAALAGALLEGSIGVAQSLARARATSSYARLTAMIARRLAPGSRVLMYHQYWFGLAQFEARSMLLPFYLSSPLYHPIRPMSMLEALRQIAPGYVLADRLVEPELYVPAGPGAEAQRREFTSFLRQQCAALVVRIDDPDYGRLSLYRCNMLL